MGSDCISSWSLLIFLLIKCTCGVVRFNRNMVFLVIFFVKFDEVKSQD